MNVKTLRDNPTYKEFYENVSYGKSSIYYLDNSFCPKPLDKLQINEVEVPGGSEQFMEIDDETIRLRLFNYQRKINNIKKKDKQTNQQAQRKDEFFSNISGKYVYLNSFDFEGMLYLKNKKN